MYALSPSMVEGSAACAASETVHRMVQEVACLCACIMSRQSGSAHGSLGLAPGLPSGVCLCMGHHA